MIEYPLLRKKGRIPAAPGTGDANKVWATDANRVAGWRDGLGQTPVTNLNSDSTTAPLAANQGKVLKGLIDTNTHNLVTAAVSGTTGSNIEPTITLSQYLGGQALPDDPPLNTLVAFEIPSTGFSDTDEETKLVWKTTSKTFDL